MVNAESEKRFEKQILWSLGEKWNFLPNPCLVVYLMYNPKLHGHDLSSTPFPVPLSLNLFPLNNPWISCNEKKRVCSKPLKKETSMSNAFTYGDFDESKCSPETYWTANKLSSMWSSSFSITGFSILLPMWWSSSFCGN